MTTIKLQLRKKAKANNTSTRVKADWDAIERAYRTGKYSLRELQARHGADNTLISRKAKKEGWTHDLSLAIKQATNARLTEALVNTEVCESLQKVSTVIAAAADENVSIIMGHRAQLADLAQAVDAAKASVLLLGSEVKDIREAAVFMQAVCNLATATKTLIEQERKAYNLDSEPERPQDEFAAFIADLSARGSRLPIGWLE